jgi:hypothetical protein
VNVGVALAKYIDIVLKLHVYNILRNDVLYPQLHDGKILLEFSGRLELQLAGEPRWAFGFAPRTASRRQYIQMFTAVLFVKRGARPWRRSKVITTVDRFTLLSQTVFSLFVYMCHVASHVLNAWIRRNACSLLFM